MKIGRNDKCPCGSGAKYKKCCLSKDERKNLLENRVKKFTRADLISSPYTKCPNCSKETFGVLVWPGGDHYTKECTTCWHTENFKFPSITKKIIYLDQFLISNMTKALDKKAQSHELILSQPFWLEAYKKLDRLHMLNLIVCPDSTFHTDESLLSGDPPFKSLKEIYERLSNGCSFYDHNTILKFQVLEHFKNFLDGVPEKPLCIDIEHIVHGELHEWLGRLRVGVNMRPYDGQLEAIYKQRNDQYIGMKGVFERWQTEKERSFMDWFWEEVGAFGNGVTQAHLNFLKRQAAFTQQYAEQYLQGIEEPEIDLNAVLPPPSSEMVRSMLSILRARGITGQKAVQKMGEYFTSKSIVDIPSIHISSLLYAGLARKAATGQKEPPNKGTFTDVNAIANLLPYCDAVFIDNGMAALLKENPVKDQMARYSAKVFSPNTKKEFLTYLDSIEDAASKEHMEIIKDAYGETWAQPHLTVLDKVLMNEEGN